MSNQILVPSLGESVTEATVAKWLVQVGDKVDADQEVVELETDKVNLSCSSPCSGIIESIKIQEGSTVEPGTLLGLVNEGKSSSKENNEEKIEKQEQKDYTPPKTVKKKNFSQKIKKTKTDTLFLKLSDEANQEKNNGALVLDTLVDEETNVNEKKYIPPKSRENLSPAVRKIAKENDIDLSNIEGTGKDGRIAKGDLLNLMGNIPQPSARRTTHGPEEKVKMTRLRATIAKRLKSAQDNAAILTTYNEVDMQAIVQMRKDFQQDFQKRYSVKLGFMSFFVKASVTALKLFPVMNAECDGSHITYKNYYNISIAISTDKGLVVPVIRKADELSFADIERNVSLLSEKAQQGKITINDLQGGTFTISNGGIWGSSWSTPILNPPQSSILGMHAISERAVVRQGQIVIRPIMICAVSYDHRIIDGKEAVNFLRCIKENLEEPRRLFLNL